MQMFGAEAFFYYLRGSLLFFRGLGMLDDFGLLEENLLINLGLDDI